MVSAKSIEIPAQLGELTARDGLGYDSVHGTGGKLAECGLLVRCGSRGQRLTRPRRGTDSPAAGVDSELAMRQ
jgi:hypothetical protein